MQKQTFTRTEEIKPVIPLRPGRQLELSRPLVMGIVNVTPDSFSDGGRFLDADQAVSHALTLHDEGADILDIGGESTRPGADPVSIEEELHRVIPVIKAVRSNSPDAIISVDTYKADVARQALTAGADLVNDISALRFDADMASVVVEHKCPLVLMHMQGTPQTMQQNPHYSDVVQEIGEFFEERLSYCESHGIDRARIILDPGIGFGKRLSDNLEILRNVSEFRRLGRPLLVGASRKGFIGMLNPESTKADTRIGGSLAAAVMAVAGGADIVRVHDVAPTVEALKIVQAIRSHV
jgi:dihydropteroate synthase